MANPKPFVKLACICEKVLIEKGDVLTLVRIVDQFFVRPIPPKVLEVGAKPQLELTVVVSLAANGLVGKHELSIQLFGPQSSQEPHRLAVEFPSGPQAGINAVVNVQVAVVKNYGDCRFEIALDGELLTAVPFRLVEPTETLVSPTAGEKPPS